MDDTKSRKENIHSFVPLVRNRCGTQTTAQIFHRVFQKEDLLYSWLEKNPDATKAEIRRKSHEIAGTLEEYERTASKRFYVIQAYREDIKTQTDGARSFAGMMILGANLMFSAQEIADEMQEYASSKGMWIWERFPCFVKVLQNRGISVEREELLAADVSQINAAEIIALIACITWTNRLRPGFIKPFLQSGTIINWLNRLEKLDN